MGMKDINILTSNGINVQKSLELFGDVEKYKCHVKVYF